MDVVRLCYAANIEEQLSEHVKETVT